MEIHIHLNPMIFALDPSTKQTAKPLRDQAGKRLHDPTLSSRAFAIFFIVTILIAITLLLVPKAGAATSSWTGPGGTTGIPVTGNWNTSTNWSPSGIPSSSNTLVLNFGGSGSTAYTSTNNISSLFTFGTMTLNSTASVTEIIGGTGNLSFFIDGSQISQTNSGAFTIQDAFDDSNTGASTTLTLTGNGTGLVTLSGVISDKNSSKNVSLVKTGTSTFMLSGANTYVGGTTIKAGTILIGVSNATTVSGALGPSAASVLLGDSAAVSNNASLLTNGAFTFSNAITVQAGNTGVATIGGNTDNNSTFSGAIALNHDLTISQVANAGANALSITGGITSGSAGTKTVTFTGPGNINVGTTAISDGSGTIAVNVTGGKTTFNVANTYTGLTNITSGTLVEGVSDAISTGALTVNGSTAVFDLGANHTDSVGTVTLDGGGAINGTGTSALTSTGTFEMKSGTVGAILAGTNIQLNKTTAGTVTLNGVNTYTGLTNITAGTLAEGVSNAIATGGVTVNGATAIFDLGANHSDSVGTVTVDGGGSITGTGTSALTSTGTFEMKSGSVSAILAGSGIALNKTTSGTVTLTGANTYSGATTISTSGGTLKIDNNNTTTARLASTSGITVDSGGTLLLAQSSGTASTDRINNSATMTLNGGKFNTGGLSEHGASNNTAGIGALTLQSSSIIDMGSATSIVAFNDSHLSTWSGTISIYNWSGDKINGGGTDQLYFGTNTSGLTSTQLSEFQFYSDAGTTPFFAGAIILSTGEVVPVPEPSTWIGGALALGAIGFMQRRRLGKLLRVVS